MFVYYNANPNQQQIGDCVIRAISLALNLDYFEVVTLLYNNSNFFNCDMLVRECYEKLLEDDFGLERIKPKTYKTVEEVANEFSDNVLLIRIKGHLTCAMYGRIYDIWDCSDEAVDCFWIV